tara:strand:+ start:268 stop:627 length:360 start_codon:yes stop_codon:yes gene_type:complete
MKSYFYFATGGGADAAADNMVVPSDQLLSINATSATTCNVYFKNPRIIENTASNSTKNYVELTYASGAFKRVVNAIIAATYDPMKWMIVVADVDNAVFIDPSITGVIVSTADSNTNPDD